MISFSSNVKINKVKKLQEEMQLLAKKQVLVGVPEGEDPREAGGGIGNAFLAYIHDNGAPSRGIPARPFMKPGIAKAQNKINKEMRAAAKAFLEGDMEEVEYALHRAGFFATNSIKDVITKGEGFAPLKRGTVLGRIRKRAYLQKKFAKPGMKELKEEMMASFKPLIDTGQLRNSIVYIVEDKT